MPLSKHPRSSFPAGFTLIELLVVIVMVSILSAIAVPSYLGWANNQRVSAARNKISSTLRKAQAQARATKINREVRFQTDPNGANPRIAIVPAVNNGTGRPQRINIPANDAAWIRLDGDGQKGLTMRVTPVSPYQSAGVVDSRDQGGIVFDPYGAIVASNGFNANPANGQLFTAQVGFGTNVNQHKRCVIVRTLLGSFQEESSNNCSL
jgi:prepilin-type N-terminal cleavage/methylation domain-containing protein